ncbi:MAG: DNA polymerase/3'-5' exonuclease PolX [marine benthic group bacterium]|nr:DNA polymerase/3'-5' exonuclease PolX [Candidatus Benthicola marisminoris]
MENLEIAAALKEMATLLEIKGGANPFRIRAYRNAVRTIEEHPVPMRKLLEEGEDLTELPAIGKDMASHIAELVNTGRLSELEAVAEEVPRSLVEVTRIPNVGPKKTAKLWKDLGVETVADLAAVAAEGKIAGLEGFGKKSEEKILAAVERYQEREVRFRIDQADQLVRPLVEHMEADKRVQTLEVAGSYRRRKETVGDIDLLVQSDEPEPVMKRFTGWSQVAEVVGAGETRGSVVLKSGLEVDLRILPEESYGAALLYFTGSKEHGVALRKRALERGLSINEYAVSELADEESGEEGTTSTTGRELGKRIAGRTEEEMYEALGLPWIPPELRENRGEIEAAEKNKLPKLIEQGDLRGDLQMHSTWSDGKNSIEEMLEACAAKDYEYFALTDHSKALAMTGGMDAEKLARQWEEIDEIVETHDEIRFLRSMEVDILAEGDLDLEEEWLERLDVVVVSVHSRFNLPEKDQTERILAAVRHPHVNILAHPTGRIINERDPFPFDLDAVFEACAEHSVAVELNAHPSRLDLKDTHLMRAKEKGAKIVISTDAHRVGELDLISYGVEQARRAWLGPADVINTWPLRKLLGFFSA